MLKDVREAAIVRDGRDDSDRAARNGIVGEEVQPLEARRLMRQFDCGLAALMQLGYAANAKPADVVFALVHGLCRSSPGN